MQREQTWDVLQSVLDSISYDREQHPSGRRFSLQRSNESNYAVLYVFSYNPDTFNRSEMRHTRHEFIVPVATYNKEMWIRWVFDNIVKMELHEITEWFMVDGKRIYAPHHGNGWDPYSFWPAHDPAEKKKSPGQD